jgi:hypothetical protein
MKDRIAFVVVVVLGLVCVFMLVVGAGDIVGRGVWTTGSAGVSSGGCVGTCGRAFPNDVSLKRTTEITASSVYTVFIPGVAKNYGAAGGVVFGYGVEANPQGDTTANIGHLQTMGLGWVKFAMRWREIEPVEGTYAWGSWDSTIDAYSAAGIKILLSISAAPDWARPTDDDKGVQGLPKDPADYAEFVRHVAERYHGKVHAIEIWSEQNLHYAVGGAGRVNPATYVQLLQQAFEAIKGTDPSILVISGGLTPSGAPLPKAMDDIEYLKEMYDNGAKEFFDAVGAHPSSYNVAPWVKDEQEACDFVTQQGSTFLGPCLTPHHSWFFLGTMEGYRDVMVANGDGDKKIIPTEFGWAVSDNPPPSYQYAYDNTYQEQAQWTVGAFQWGGNSGWVGPMFFFNLDYGVAAPGSPIAYWSLLMPSGPVPAYIAIANMPK